MRLPPSGRDALRKYAGGMFLAQAGSKAMLATWAEGSRRRRVGEKASGGETPPLQAQNFRYTKSEQLKQMVTYLRNLIALMFALQNQTPRCINRRLSMCLKFRPTGGRILKVGESGDSYTLSALFCFIFCASKK